MNDTHGVEGKGWYGFDLDGTLAVYDKWEGIDHIGEPVKPMVDLIRKMHAEGKVVKILTARVAPMHNENTDPSLGLDGPKDVYDGEQSISTFERREDGTPVCAVKRKYASDFIREWCEKHLGFIPEITHEKDHLMLELYDDRVKQVVPNSGVLVEDIAVRETLNSCKLENSYMVRFGSFTNGVMLGWLVALVILVGVHMVWDLCHRTPADKALDNLRSAIIEVQEALK